MAFAVIFTFVGANALWYQPGAHPSPLLSTRARLAHMAKADPASAHAGAAKLTIDEVLASASPKQARALPQSPDVVPTGSIPKPGGVDASAQSDPVIAEIQKALGERQFYNGPIDGLDGQRTRAAIEAFQAATARPLTGNPSETLLAEIRATHRNAVAIPRSKPENGAQAGADVTAKLAAQPRSVAVPAPRPLEDDAASRSSTPKSTRLVARIQTGLHNIAYSNVAVDGIAGDKTKAAIRNFEKNYRLPVTGEPNERVLKKLIAIGAI